MPAVASRLALTPGPAVPGPAALLPSQPTATAFSDRRTGPADVQITSTEPAAAAAVPLPDPPPPPPTSGRHWGSSVAERDRVAFLEAVYESVPLMVVGSGSTVGQEEARAVRAPLSTIAVRLPVC